MHLIGGIIATLTIASFFTSTIAVELLGSKESIAITKRLIVFPGLFILVPAIATTGATGFRLSISRGGNPVQNKKRRMFFIGFNGIFILAPCAILLNLWAGNGSFHERFYMLQSIEIFAGGINLCLMGLNIKDGFRLTGRFGAKRCLPSAET